jgi:glutamate-5-semialdehyde dehydrogenase
MNKVENSIKEMMADIGRRAKKAASILAITNESDKNAALRAMASSLLISLPDIIEANEKDMANGRKKNLSNAILDRLKLDEDRIIAIADSIIAISKLDDPVGSTIAQWEVDSGLHIKRVRTPLGVIGIIYESRPNVTADAGALCLKAGNAAILRGGSDSFFSSEAIHKAMQEGLKVAGLPLEAIQLINTTNRDVVGEMLKGLNGNIDVIVPRGGASLVARVQADARVPIFSHLEGICHLYIDKSAELNMAVEIALNSKMRRTGICGATETLLLDEAIIDTHLAPICAALKAAGCKIRGDAKIVAKIDDVKAATEQDWSTEYLDAIISIKIVDGADEAIAHIEKYSSHHTEAIVASDGRAVKKFFTNIDSAILIHNASTQFADGGEFGMGAEIGIATGKMHARGPVGVEQLTSFKYLVQGNGQVRP